MGRARNTVAHIQWAAYAWRQLVLVVRRFLPYEPDEQFSFDWKGTTYAFSNLGPYINLFIHTNIAIQSYGTVKTNLLHLSSPPPFINRAVDNAVFPVQWNYSLGKRSGNTFGRNQKIVSNCVLNNMTMSWIKADKRGYFRWFLLHVHKK